MIKKLLASDGEFLCNANSTETVGVESGAILNNVLVIFSDTETGAKFRVCMYGAHLVYKCGDLKIVSGSKFMFYKDGDTIESFLNIAKRAGFNEYRLEMTEFVERIRVIKPSWY